VSSSEIILKQEFDNFQTIKTRNNRHAEKYLSFIFRKAYPDHLARGDKKTLGAALQKLVKETEKRGLQLNQDKTSSRRKTDHIRKRNLRSFTFKKVQNFKYISECE
jgi:polynucleotide 5'-kinase involved in rRNA processing